MKKFGHYEVTAELGRGGMGVVYKGWEPSLNRQVAIKALGEHLLNDKDLVERFTREAKATAAINNPNVIQIYYIGKESEQPYFSMEYIEGQSLDDILKGGQSLTVAHAKNILKQACLGLVAAHQKDLVHRDIKPANIMLTTAGMLKIVDFGIARTREYGEKLTNTGEFVGTPGYLSPEVCIGKEVDERSDIFSLGIVFYEMLAGKVPFENDSPLGLMLEVVQSDIPDIRALNKKVDKKTSYILNKMIAKSPDDRYQNCDEIIRDLGNTIDNQNIAAIKQNAQIISNKIVKSKVSEQITLPSVAAITAKNSVLTSQPKNRAPWVLASLLLVMVAAAGTVYYGGYFSSSNPNSNDVNQANGLLDNTSGLESKSDSVEFAQMDSNHNNDLTSYPSTSQELLASSEDVAAIDSSNAIDFSSQLSAPENNESTIHPTQTLATSDANKPLVKDLTNLETSQENKQATRQATMDQTLHEATSLPNQELVSAAHVVSSNQFARVETKSNHPALLNESSKLIANRAATQAPLQVKPKPALLDKGVVVIAFGDPAIANPIEKIIESQLKQQGVKVMNEQFITGMKQLRQRGLNLAELKNLIQNNGGQAMVIASVNYVGSQRLQYAGRSTELINAQIDIDTYDIKTGDSLDNGFGSKIDYTALNATDQATDAVIHYSNQLAIHLKNRI